MKIIVLLFLFAAPLAQANLVILAPFTDPAVQKRIFGEANEFHLDGAYAVTDNTYPPGWYSWFPPGIPGGTLFSTNVFETYQSGTARVWWDFTGTDYFMTLIQVEAPTTNTGDQAFSNRFYSVGANSGSVGSFEVDTGGSFGPIGAIDFWGNTYSNVPEGGPGMTLLLTGVIALFGVQRKFR